MTNDSDYAARNYLSVLEVSNYSGLSVSEIHRRVKSGEINATKSASGQYRFALNNIAGLRVEKKEQHRFSDQIFELEVSNTTQVVICNDSRNMSNVDDNSVHLVITSPPYFNAKMYSESPDDMGNIHNLDDWLGEIKKVWAEVYRVLQPGRKFFLNIMNLPIRLDKSFRSLNLTGKSIDLCEDIGFIFKRDIVWHKTNGVRAHFGTYPYPGGILINNMHEFILEFQKPMHKTAPKYSHVTDEQKERSRLGKDFWLSVKNSDVWLIAPEKSGESRNHAAPFPLELPRRLIKAYSFVGETILDPFLGSGTTLMAASLNERNGIGYEINPQFCAIAKNSLANRLL